MNIAAEARMSGYRDSLSPVPTNAQLENGLPMSDGLGSYSVGRYSANSGNPYQPAGMRDSIRDGHGHDINGPSAYATSNMDSNSLYPTPTPHNVPKPEAELPEGATIAKVSRVINKTLNCIEYHGVNQINLCVCVFCSICWIGCHRRNVYYRLETLTMCLISYS
jgi:hypothetical protein